MLYFSLSNGTKSESDSVELTQFIIKFIYKNEYTQTQFDLVHKNIRTFAHIFLYFSLGAVSGLWVYYASARFSKRYLIIIAAFLCSLIGFADEWFKQYVPGRHFDANEVIINFISAIIGLLFVSLMCFVHLQKRKNV